MNDTVDYAAATMTPATVPHDPDAAYELVRGLVFDQIHKFHSRYGGDLDDLEGEAGLAFVKGHTEFITGKTYSGQPIKAAYSTRIRLWVWFTLFDQMRARIAKNDATEAIVDRDFAADAPAIFDREDFEDGMGNDARAVVALILDPPPTVAAAAAAKGGSPRNVRSTVRRYLAEAAAWAPERINAAFGEIRGVLAV